MGVTMILLTAFSSFCRVEHTMKTTAQLDVFVLAAHIQSLLSLYTAMWPEEAR